MFGGSCKYLSPKEYAKLESVVGRLVRCGTGMVFESFGLLSRGSNTESMSEKKSQRYRNHSQRMNGVGLMLL